MIPILAEFMYSPRIKSDRDRWILCGVYLPYFVIPLVLAARVLFTDELFPVVSAAAPRTPKAKRR